jgi:catechol 2,3-dioxygenase-like lactoylglutathione lyase family enzyme
VPALLIVQKFRAFPNESAYNSDMDFTLEHIGLSARAPATLKDWYVKTLGARVVFDNGSTPPMFLLSLPGGMMIEIYAGDFSLAETSQPVKPAGGGGRVLFFPDPEGNLLHFVERSADLTVR